MLHLKKMIHKFIFPNTYSSQAYVNYLKKNKIDIGENCYFWSPNSVYIDIQRPHMLHIGDYTKITSGVKILCHDYSRSVLCNMPLYGNVGEAATTFIGDNVFIGINSIVLMGSHIGSNSVVGAGSVVSGIFQDNVVIAGNPAKVICSIEDYYNKRKKIELASAVNFACSWKRKNGNWPTINEMTNSFVWLYLPHSEDTVRRYNDLFKLNGVDNNNMLSAYINSKPVFNSFEEFIDYCDKDEETV